MIDAGAALVIDAEVVVIGSGGAGLCAAAAANRAGALTVLVTKGRAGRANCTAYAGGGFTVAPPPEVAAGLGGALTPEQHYDLSLQTGRRLNDPALLGTLCRDGATALRELECHFGVAFDWHHQGCSVSPFGRPPLLGGLGLTDPLVAHLRQAGVALVEDAVVTSILRAGDGVTGVRGYVLDGAAPDGAGGASPASRAPVARPLEIRARAVVVATGGGGSMYGRTDNPPRTTGDGYLLLSQAGALLEDMEFVQFYPMGIAEPGLRATLLGAELLDAVSLTDEEDREPLAGKFAEWGIRSGQEANLYARDRLAVTLARHIAAGHELFLHLEDLPGADLRGADLPDGLGAYVRACFPASFDPFKGPVRVAPTQHYFCGGAVIDPAGEVLGSDRAPIPGLFACGEVTAGVDGANRVGGNALTNIVVFGLAAGQNAARYAAGRAPAGRAPAGCPPAGRATAGRAESSRQSEGRAHDAGAASPSELRHELHRLCDGYLGPVRSAPKLEEALARLEDLVARAGRLAAAVVSPGPGAPAPTRSDVLLALELPASVATATFVARAALARTESRGAHFREDYPSEEEAWVTRHVALHGEGGVSVRRAG